ncbi:MAG: N-acyl homoserine lactonase family protein [Armatimonadetes bacterium]|nr:N-acyl homoserine lactonase family protein [Anaerolineae bacterium]
MNIHAITTGTVRITHHWREGHGAYPLRLLRTLTDRHLTEPLPIWCYLIEHPEGLIVIDTGIPANANQRVWFPPHMILAQRAAPFQIQSAAEELGMQLQTLGFAPADVRWVILTHLHQDHEGGLHHFPNAEFIVARAEWAAAQGIKGRMAGYLNQRWFKGFAPTPVDFTEPDPVFNGRHSVTRAGDVYLVPTPGHSAGHLSVIVEDNAQALFFAGDASYTQALLLADALDGVSPNAAHAHDSHQRILTFARQTPTVYLPSHEWDAQRRLAQREPIPLP